MTKVAVAQFAIRSKPEETNLNCIAAMAKEAAAAGAKLIVFPETSLPGYDLKNLPGKIPQEKEVVSALQKIAEKCAITLFVGLAVQTAKGQSENIAVLVDSDKLLLRYTKTHLFDFKSARESDLFTRGDGPLALALWEKFQAAPLICFDLRFPELARYYAKQGADLFLTSSAWPFARAEVFFTLARARAIENQAYLLSSNFVGKNLSGDQFAGCSAIFAPDGTVLAQLDSEKEGIIFADIDLATVKSTRRDLDCQTKQRDTNFYI